MNLCENEESIQYFITIEKIFIEGEGPINKMGMSAVYFNKYIAVFGGRDEKSLISNLKSNEIYLLNIVKRIWEPICLYGFAHSPRWGHCMAYINNKIVVFGGVTGERFCSSSVYELETSKTN